MALYASNNDNSPNKTDSIPAKLFALWSAVNKWVFIAIGVYFVWTLLRNSATPALGAGVAGRTPGPEPSLNVIDPATLVDNPARYSPEALAARLTAGTIPG